MLSLLAVAAMIAAPLQDTDTTFAVAPNARLNVSVMRGDLVIRTWNRNEIRVIADHSRSMRIAVSGSSSSARVRVRDEMGGMSDVDMEMTVPASMSIQVDGTFLDTDIDGVEGEVSVQTVQGDVTVRGGRGRVSLHSVQGDIVLSGAVGRIDVSSSNGEITLSNVDGEISAESLNGEVELRGIHSGNVEATTINGEISYDGTIEDNGRYRFETHNGDITLSVSPDVSATFTVSTFAGEFDSSFDITLTESSSQGKRLGFTLGRGSARVSLSSFGGTISLKRP